MSQNLPPSARSHYVRQQALTAATVRGTARSWARMGDDFDASWRAVGPRLLVLLTAGMVRSAAESSAYTSVAAEQVGLDPTRVATVDARAFARTASDGRPLLGLLEGAVVAAKRAVAGGAAVPVALAAGRAFLDVAIPTQVADAARGAELVTMTATPAVTGYVRAVSPGACRRCAILAGKHFRWDNDFLRHPRCHCQTVPSGEGSTAGVLNPRDHFAGLSRSEQDRIYGRDDAEAIRDGADPIAVVNSLRGTYTPSGRRAPTPSKRATPGAIYRLAGGDRTKALELLTAAGYLT